MTTELIINASLPETRIALMEDAEIQELLIERAQGKGIVGNIYKGKVTRVLPGMQAAFVDIGLEKAAFLYVDDVYVHSEIFDEEEGNTQDPAQQEFAQIEGAATGQIRIRAQGQEAASDTQVVGETSESQEPSGNSDEQSLQDSESESFREGLADYPGAEDEDDDADFGESDEDSNDNENDDEPVGMCPAGDGGDEGSGHDDNAGNRVEGTIAPPAESGGSSESSGSSGDSERKPVIISSGTAASGEGAEAGAAGGAPQGGDKGEKGDRGRRHRRGRRGGRFRNKRGGADEGLDASAPRDDQGAAQEDGPENKFEDQQVLPDSFHHQMTQSGDRQSDRNALSNTAEGLAPMAGERPDFAATGEGVSVEQKTQVIKAGFQSQRGRDKRIKGRSSLKPPRGQVNIQDILQEGQEVLVQVAKDPIATKGARLTCHISLPGRHLVCMPTIDHVGVSRRIDSDGERRKLREMVDRFRPKGLGFIVRTASGKQQSAEKRVKQDIDYLASLWNEIREKAANVQAPALVYEDLNAVLRAIRDWVTEDIDKVMVDSRYHYNEILRFVSNFMPSLKPKVELYHGDIPIFDAYNLSTELARSLERKVWLKSGGYIVIDQAEALVAIDVNTGRYVGKKNLEDTILKTNLEAVQEIAYQLRLRNCGGIIILDLIDMEREENRQRVYRALEEALKKDRARPTILKISELGLVEMTRKRTRDTIIRTLCEPCVHCEAKGFIKSRQTVAFEVLRQIEREGLTREASKVLVQAHSDVIDILAMDERETLEALERRYRKQIYLQSVGDFHPEQFEVSGDRHPTQQSSQERFGAGSRRDRPRRGGGERSNEKGGERERNDRGDRGDRGDRDRGRNAGGRTEGGVPRPTGTIIIKPVVIQAPSAQGEGGTLDTARIHAESQAGGAMEQSPGNDSSTVGIVGAPHDSGSTGNRPAGGDDFYDEEDRLAFLRAQAAQDAALAKLGAASAGNTLMSGRADNPRRGDRPDRGGRGGRNKNGRGKGGKFRGPRDNNRAPRNFEARPSTGIQPVSASAISASAPSSSGDGGGSEGGGSSAPSGGEQG